MAGKINDINKTMSELEYRVGCIHDQNNSIELNLTIFNQRLLTENQDTIEYGVPKRYKINLNLNSGFTR